MEVITKSGEETKKLGSKIAASLKKGTVIALVGELGAGKTTFTQGFCKYFGLERVISPTFLLVRKYGLKKTEKFESIYHVDLYRLETNIKQELESLGVIDQWKNKKNIILVEWADKAESVFPKDTIWINFENMGKEKRKITVKK